MRSREEVLKEFRLCRDWCNKDGEVTCVDARCRGRLPDAEAMADRIRSLEATPARVTLLDEWRVLDKDGCSDGTFSYTLHNALNEAKAKSHVFPSSAPHRVMRVALVEVPDAA